VTAAKELVGGSSAQVEGLGFGGTLGGALEHVRRTLAAARVGERLGELEQQLAAVPKNAGHFRVGALVGQHGGLLVEPRGAVERER
jgi:hypothetical protein